ncbi:MAG TPA: PIN domain-containing protein [Acidimicrobiia bacterium]
MSLFVDTSAWYALLDRSDRSHERITAILGGAGELVLTDHVLVETHRLAAHRLGGAVADRFWTAVNDGQATLEPVGLADLGGALAIRIGWPDQAFSLVDCTSFVVMQRLRITAVVTLDDDFAVFRFGSRRQHAFEIAR